MAKDMQNEKPSAPQKSAGRKAAGRKKKSVRMPINLFDVAVIVVLVVVAVIALGSTQLATLFGIGERAEPCTVEYMVMFADVDQDLALAVSDGSAVYGNSTGASMGEVITSPEVQAHRVVTYADGTSQMKDKPGSVDVIVTVRASAQYTEGVGYTVGDTVVRVGDNLSLRFPGYTGVGSCINISRTSD
ncbi:MAG: DUF4330 domain-containing protein [Clostridia bacterium]|nr:DUF4330 domain-containing protein [Clostridia bacterium]